MLADGEETASRSSGLGKLGESGEFSRDTLSKQFARQLRRRWKILGAILVTALTTFAIYRVDEAFSKDAVVFAGLTVALILYTLLTIRSDLQLE